MKADSAHYTVVLENEHVRVLHIHYGAREKDNMHSHPCSVTVFLTDGNLRNDHARRKEQDRDGESRTNDLGSRRESPAGKHQRSALRCDQNRIEKSAGLHEVSTAASVGFNFCVEVSKMCWSRMT